MLVRFGNRSNATRHVAKIAKFAYIYAIAEDAMTVSAEHPSTARLAPRGFPDEYG
jgi:hypothetical protein